MAFTRREWHDVGCHTVRIVTIMVMVTLMKAMKDIGQGPRY